MKKEQERKKRGGVVLREKRNAQMIEKLRGKSGRSKERREKMNLCMNRCAVLLDNEGGALLNKGKIQTDDRRNEQKMGKTRNRGDENSFFNRATKKLLKRFYKILLRKE